MHSWYINNKLKETLLILYHCLTSQKCCWDISAKHAIVLPFDFCWMSERDSSDKESSSVELRCTSSRSSSVKDSECTRSIVSWQMIRRSEHFIMLATVRLTINQHWPTFFYYYDMLYFLKNCFVLRWRCHEVSYRMVKLKC